MKRQLFVLSVIILWCSTLCYGAERRKAHDSIPSPSGTYQLSTTINREKTDKRRYLCIKLHLADVSGNEISHMQTGASDRMKWAAGWMKDQDIVIVYSSDVGTLAYAIDVEKQFMPLKPTEDMLKRGEELKQAKYSAGKSKKSSSLRTMKSFPDALDKLSPIELLQYLESIPLPTDHQTTEAVVLMPRRDWITEEHIPEILKYMNSEKIVPIVAHGISSMLHFGVTTLGTHARCLLEGFIRNGYSGCTCTDQVKCKPADEYLQWWKTYTSDASIHAEIQKAESFVREAGKNFEEGGIGLDYDLIIPSPEEPSSEITILWQRTYKGIAPNISSHLSSLYLHLFILKKPGDAVAYAPYCINKLKARFLEKRTSFQYGINGRLLFIVSGYDYIAIQDILFLFSETPPDQQKIDACIENLRNSDIRWDGTFSGLFPVVEGEVAKQLFSFGSYPTPALIATLDDPEKFVAAHVLLTLIHYKQFSTSASQWNGLTVELHANGDVVIDPGQIPTIKAMWEKEMFKASDSDEGRSQQ